MRRAQKKWAGLKTQKRFQVKTERRHFLERQGRLIQAWKTAVNKPAEALRAHFFPPKMFGENH